MTKTFLFQAIPFCMSTQFTSIWPIERTLLGSTSPGQCGHWCDGNQGVLSITLHSCITDASSLDRLVSIQDIRGGEFLPCEEIQSVYSITPADWVVHLYGFNYSNKTLIIIWFHIVIFRNIIIWTQRHEFKSWTRMIAFHIALILLGKVWIQLFSLQLWVNSRRDWVIQPWLGLD